MESSIDIKLEIERLMNYGISKKLIHKSDVIYLRNVLFDRLNVDSPTEREIPEENLKSVDDILNNILTYCYEMNFIPDSTVTQRDIFATMIMGILTPLPAVVEKNFKMNYANSPMDATDYLYNLSLDVNYIQTARMKKNCFFDYEKEYGRIDCTINFARPEKTAQEMEASDQFADAVYPKCALCAENVGFVGNARLPAKQNLRIVPLYLADEECFFQYSPHSYYNEHCLVVTKEHRPMRIERKSFETILDFVDQYPHYFLGVNADLPFVGDTILEHQHYQGGCNMFPIEYAESNAEFVHPSFKGVRFYMMNWPVSTIRIEGDNIEILTDAADYIKDFWQNYDNERLGIKAYTFEEEKSIPHNTVCAVARKNNRSNFEVDIFLRNNATSNDAPYGIFNTRESARHIKNENVAMVECLGLAVFPGKYDYEILHILGHLLSGKNTSEGVREGLEPHIDWINYMVEKYGVINTYEMGKEVLYFETGKKFGQMLFDCGVFKLNGEGIHCFKEFMKEAGFEEAEEY